MFVTASHPLTRALPTNGDKPDFREPDVSDTEPSGDGVFLAGGGGDAAPQQVEVYPIGEGGPGTTFELYIYAWRLYGAPADEAKFWLDGLLASFACTLGQYAGLQGRLLKPSERFASELVLTGGWLGRYGGVVSPAAKAWFRLDLQGCQRFQFIVRAETALGNALWAPGSYF